MNIKRFHAATAREALAKARMAFGEGTLILSNRPTANGVEVVATAEDSLDSLAHQASAAPAAAPQAPRVAPSRSGSRPGLHDPLPGDGLGAVQEDTEKLAMSTLSFQDYVRERMLRRRHEALNGTAAPASPAPAMQATEPAFARDMAAAPARATPQRATPAPAPRHAAAVVPQMFESEPPAPRKPAVAAAPAINTQGIFNELQAMKDLIEERFNTLSWLGQARQDPIQSNLMLKMIRAGYSPALAKAILERLPADMEAGDALRWMMDVLERNLRTDADQEPLYREGGIYALVGATGVGKTTTTAKLAAMCVREHGPGSVGLITLDTYRIAAHEQLRTYGRMLGMVAHLAHDRAALQDLLSLLANKKMILIDTTGLAPRDPR